MDKLIMRFNGIIHIGSLYLFAFLLQSCASPSAGNLKEREAAEPLRQYDLQAESYRIVPRDIVEVLSPVKKDDEKLRVLANSLAFEVVDGELFSRQRLEVNPFGEIDLPLLGTLKLAGLTSAQANELLLQRSGRFYKRPKAFLKVMEYKGYDQRNRIAVMGEVNQPGVYAFQQRLNLFEAVSLAGGYRNTAKLEGVVLVHNGYTAQPVYEQVDLRRVLNGRDIAQDIEVKGGDIIYVPATLIGNVGTFTELFFGRLRPAAQTYLDYYEAVHVGDD